jgi:hypothetical protein
LKFLGELWARRACAGTKQQELTTCAKSGGQHKKKIQKKRGRPTLSKHRPGLLFLLNFFKFLCFLLYFGQFFIGSLENGPGLLGEWVHSTPIFSSFSLHLEVSNLPFLIEFGDFIFFKVLFFLNLE